MAYLLRDSNNVTVDDGRSDGDVYFGDESHPGTKKWRKAVRMVAKKHDEPFAPDIYRLIKRQLDGMRFFALEGYPDKKWEEVEKKELIKQFGAAYEDAKNKILDESFTENTDVDLGSPPPSPRRSMRNSAMDSPARSPKPRVSRRKSDSELMMKTVTMYFPPPETGDFPEVSENLTPMSNCSEQTVAALTSPQAVAQATLSSSSRVTPNSPTQLSSSGVAGMPDRGPADLPSDTIFGRSIFQVPNSHNRLVAEASFEKFAPLECICCQQCVGDQQRARTFARVYENRLEVNQPYAPWCCFTPEFCIVDDVRVYYFDKGPSQAYCGRNAELDCLAEICGQPVVFVQVPRCCCNLVDLRPCFGERVYASPCTCCDLRWPWCCIGKPCYEQFACPLIYSVRDGKKFLAKYRGAVDDYAKTRPIKRHTKFHRVSEKPCGCDKVSVMESYPVDHSMYQYAMKLKDIPGAIPNVFVMDRS